MPTLVTDDPAADSHLPHTVEVDAQSRMIRLYLWAYSARVNRINTCKLFWAFVFMPFWLPFVVVGKGMFVPAAGWLGEKIPDRKPRPYVPPVENPEPSKGERAIESIGNFMGRSWFRIQPLLKWGGILIGIAIAVALIFLAATNLDWVLEALIVVGISVGMILALGLLLGGTITLLDKSRKVHGFFRLMKVLGRNVHTHTCANVRVKGE